MLFNVLVYVDNNRLLRGRPRFRVTKAQIESLREIGFSWTKIAELIGVSRITLYRDSGNWRSESNIITVR